MLLNSWLKNLTARFGRAPARPVRRRHAYRIMLEPLESRLAPAVHTWTGNSALNDNWSEPANWDAFGVPTSGELDGGTIVTFPTSAPSIQNLVGLFVDDIIFTSDDNTITIANPLFLRTNVVPTTIRSNVGDSNVIKGSVLILTGGDATIQVSNAVTLTIESQIVGNFGFNKKGLGTLELKTQLPSTYVGATRIDDGTLKLNTKTTDSGVSGAILVGDGTGTGGSAILQLAQGSEIPNDGIVSVLSDGRINFEPGVTEDIAALLMKGGRVNLAATSVLQIGPDGSVTASVAAGSLIDGAGQLRAVGDALTFSIADVTADVNADLVVAARITEAAGGAELIKIGLGTLELSAGGAGNGYTGLTRIDNGALRLNTDTANAGLSNTIQVGDGIGGVDSAVLELVRSDEISNLANVVVLRDGRMNVPAPVAEGIQNLTLFDGHVRLDGVLQINAGGTVASSGEAVSVIDGAGQLGLEGGTIEFDVADATINADLFVAARITGGGALTKTGTGTLELSGTAGNSYSGPTTVNAGVLELAKTTGNAVPGALIVDNTGSVVRLLASNQIADAAAVRVSDFALLNLNGFDDVIGPLTLGDLSGDGGNVTTGAGALILNGNITRVIGATAGVSTISGQIDLNGATRTIAVEAGPQLVELNISALIIDSVGGAGLIKSGPGTLKLSAGGIGNTFTGETLINDGAVLLNSITINAGLSDVILVGDGVGPGDSAVLQLVNSNEIPDEGQLIVLADGRVDVGPNVVERILFLGVHGGQVNLAANGVIQIGDGGQVFSQVSVDSVIDGPGILRLDGTVAFAIDGGPGTVDLAVTAIITGTAGVNKLGTGLLRLSGINTYNGPTRVGLGALQVDGSQPNSAVTLDGGTLGGSGTVGPITGAGGILAPGLLTATVPVALKSGSLSLGAATFAPLISGTPGGAADQLVVTGTVNLTGATLAPIRNGIGAAVGQAFRVLDNDAADPVVGTFVGLPEGASLPVNGQTFVVTYRGGDGNDVELKRIANVLVTGPDAGAPPRVRVFDVATQTQQFNFLAYSARFKGGVRVASADINSDGFPDIITAPGPGTAALVKVFSGVTQPGQTPQLLRVIKPYGNFKGGAFVAAGDINGDGIPDIIVGPGSTRAPTVMVFNGANGTPITSFNAFPASFKGGVTVAAGDVNGDGKIDIIAGMGSGSQPRVRVFDAGTPTQLAGAIGSFLAYPGFFKGGVFVAAGDLNGDGSAEIITGPGAGITPFVKVFMPTTVTSPRQILAYPPGQKRGVRVGTADINGDGRADILAALGPQGRSEVRVFGQTSTSAIDSFFSEGGAFKLGMFVAGSR